MSADSEILIFDIEATGLDTANDQIIELAIQLGIAGETVQKVWRIKPDKKISAEATAVHGITDSDLANCPKFAQLAEEIRNYFAKAKVIVAYNATYDIAILQNEYQRIGKPLELNDKLVLDPLRLWRKCEPRNLDAAVERFAKGTKYDAHAAAGDVKATAAVLVGMKQQFSLTDKSWEELAIFSDPERLTWIGPTPHLKWKQQEIIIGFGKNQGKSLTELAKKDSSYLSWILSKDFPEHVKTVIQEALSGDPKTLPSRLSERFGPPPAQ